MTAAPLRRESKRLKAPPNDGQTLEDPSLHQLHELWKSNQICWTDHRFSLFGWEIQDVRRLAQQHLVESSLQYTERYAKQGVIAPELNPSHFVLAGHQPELFHCGVWFKNFVLSNIAQRFGATAVNLVIDNDLCATKSIRVPGGSLEHPEIHGVAFDELGPIVPFEMVPLNDRASWNSFGTRVCRVLQPIIQDPLIASLWPEVEQAQQAGLPPALAIAAGRHRIEIEHGSRTLELPLSQLCSAKSFGIFVAELCARHEELNEIYNEALLQYRFENRIRSQSHPVPELRVRGEWFELPLWILSQTSPHRRSAWVKRTAQGFVIGDGNGFATELSSAHLLQELAGLESNGILLRPRALVTTMYSRLVLGQMFLHGIGGAKYDQLTDRIIQRFLGVTPPGFATLSATLRLPIPIPTVSDLDVSRQRIKQRDLRYHPEWFVDHSDPHASQLANTKQQLIARSRHVTDRAKWHRQMEAVNQQLMHLTDGWDEVLQEELGEIEKQLRTKQILGSREFSFCLHPIDVIERLKQLAVV